MEPRLAATGPPAGLVMLVIAAMLAPGVRAQSTPSAHDDVGQATVAVIGALQQEEEKKAEASREAGMAEAVAEQQEELEHFQPMPSRWYEAPLPWALMPPPVYEINEPGGRWWDAYRQNPLKGDFPLFGEDVFFRFTFTEKVIVEGRNIPTGSGITGPGANNADFFGGGEQLFVTAKSAISFDLFKGQEAFKPVDWRVRITPVIDVTYLDLQELSAVNINPADGTNRTTGDVALQEALVEIHLLDLNDRFDFLSFEAGIIPFRSDFRGFIFEDVNLGARILGNADANRWQYNLLFFNMLEKDTYSELNRFRERDQQVVIFNVYRQDIFVLGYQLQASFHWNHDQASEHFNRADFLVRPQPVGLARRKSLDAYYLGIAGEGHFGRFNVTHAFYQVFGHEENNAFAARDTDINAQFAALEVSYDFDWLRVRAYGMYASGDDDTRDGDAEGFDAILDAPNFAGGEFSLFMRQDIRLLGTGLTGRLSFLPDLTTSKLEGQANFVNPGLLLVGGAVDVEIMPEWRGQIGVNYLRFAETDPLEIFLETENIDEEIGVEFFMGTQYRPLLTNNILITVGAAALIPGDGYEKIYQTDELQWQVFLDLTLTY